MCGRVLDQQDKPVADAGISFYWNVNEVTLEELQKFETNSGDDTMFSINEGRMEPLGHPDQEGHRRQLFDQTRHRTVQLDSHAPGNRQTAEARRPHRARRPQMPGPVLKSGWFRCTIEFA